MSHILIVGVGSIGQRHVENFLTVDDVRCSIAETDETIRQRVADQFPIEQAYADFHEADLPAFDGVVICTPTNTHIRFATEIVSAGTHVLCEKPLGTSLDGVDELKRARDANGVSVGIAFVMRCDPIFGEMKAQLDDGAVGTVYKAHSSATQYWPRARKGFPPQYAMSRATGGGAIQDHMVHHINLFEWFFGQPVSVAARHWQLGLGLPTEDTAAVTIEFPKNIVAQLEISLCQQNPAWSVHVAGESSTLRVGCNFDHVDRY
ncbi:MAG: Gfo/Idh/MocA family oxidoreductase, partial [Lentisphaeria bacterium]|nr:Gfo/Idh/MocA family oxidoreductase [Lentisphaeria bacterium]